MEKNVFIIDSEEVFVRSLVEELNFNRKYHVVGYSLDGKDVINTLKKYPQIDFLLINTLLPINDGYAILNDIKKDESIRIKHIIVMQYFVNEVVINTYKNLFVDDFILKPIHVKSVIMHLDQFDITNMKNNINTLIDESNSLEKNISLLLHDVGIPSSIKGYVYLREAIKKCYYSNDGYLGSITKRLYPEVAKTFMTTSSRVERAIRHAIEVAFSRGDLNIISKIFGSTISHFKDKPTNAEFISIFADHLKMESKSKINI